jgi:predicted amidohydrolase
MDARRGHLVLDGYATVTISLDLYCQASSGSSCYDLFAAIQKIISFALPYLEMIRYY